MPRIQYLNSPAFTQLGLPFSEIVRVDDTLYLSGQMGTLPGSLQLAPGGVEAESEQALRNVQQALEHHGFSMRDVVKCTVMLANMDDWPAFNAIYKQFFQQPYPARSAFGASGLALGGRLEIEVMAVVGDRS
ncbi:RidA family protein [Ottowia thiooxydans]|uniref:2-iminobutanoate/2-iminopropanoate deaminase n=1 Tax=Ottowia thiooxydans TaxID=219182 RepID=A0ABV2QBP1_9BURK